MSLTFVVVVVVIGGGGDGNEQSSVRMKILVKQVLLHILEGQIDYDQVRLRHHNIISYDDEKGG